MPQRTVNTFPFTAVTGMDDAKRALECALTSPHIHSVLLRGGRGTAKSTLARSVAGITGKKIVECPASISEEQLFGGLDIERTIKGGERMSEHGLLSRADGNILYIDNVNLMERSLLSGIADAVQTGIVHLERGPGSETYPCRTVLIASMDPEDGDLSDQALDRFDLCAGCPPSDSEEKRLIIERATKFSDDPEGFILDYQEKEKKESEKISRATKILPLVTISDGLISVISELCVRLGAEGSRGDLAVYNCATALAALDGRDEVVKKDVEDAAVLCLVHRRGPEQSNERQPDHDERNENREENPEMDNGNEEKEGSSSPSTETDSKEGNEKVQDKAPDIGEMMFEIGRQFRTVDYLMDGRRPRSISSRNGGRSVAVSTDGSGRYSGYRMPQGRPRDIAFDATIRNAAPYQRSRARKGLAVAIETRDIREKIRERRRGTTILFLVDASGSLGVRRRMATVKGAVLSMLKDSYVKRDRVGLMAFRRTSAELVLPPTGSVEFGYRCLEDLPTGGKTPLGAAMVKAEEYMAAYAKGHPGEGEYIVLVTDGRANVPMKEGADANEEVLGLAERMAGSGIGWIVVDASVGFPHFDNAKKLAEKLCARYYKLEELDADRFAEGVKIAVRS